MYYLILKARALLAQHDINLDRIKIGVAVGVVLLGLCANLVSHSETEAHSIGSSESVEVCYVRDSEVIGVQNEQGLDYLAKGVRNYVDIAQCEYIINVR